MMIELFYTFVTCSTVLAFMTSESFVEVTESVLLTHCTDIYGSSNFGSPHQSEFLAGLLCFGSPLLFPFSVYTRITQKNLAKVMN